MGCEFRVFGELELWKEAHHHWRCGVGIECDPDGFIGDEPS
jgi:hypothetical protein